MQGESSLELGFLRSHLHKGRMLWKLPGLGTTYCPPWKEQKGKGRAFVGSQGSRCLLPHLLEALLQPAFYRCLASPIVTAPQEGSSQEALNNFNFQKVGKKEQRGRAREEGRRKRFKTICARSKGGRAG